LTPAFLFVVSILAIPLITLDASIPVCVLRSGFLLINDTCVTAVGVFFDRLTHYPRRLSDCLSYSFWPVYPSLLMPA
jgi:hypothetical protein